MGYCDRGYRLEEHSLRFVAGLRQKVEKTIVQYGNTNLNVLQYGHNQHIRVRISPSHYDTRFSARRRICRPENAHKTIFHDHITITTKTSPVA